MWHIQPSKKYVYPVRVFKVIYCQYLLSWDQKLPQSMAVVDKESEYTSNLVWKS